jgi:hypothetical protein
MRFKTYCVTLHFSGTHTFFISAPDEEEAVDVAHDELANLAGDLEYEVTDAESYQDDDGE